MTRLLDEPRTTHKWLLVAGALGIFASFLLLFCSIGTNDVRTWEKFAAGIRTSGLFRLYERDPLFNHPPLMGLFAWLCHVVSSSVGVPFAFVFKLVPVVANAATAALLWEIWRDRSGLLAADRVFALFGWSLCSILVAAFHGNTDCLCAFLCLLTLRCLEREKHGLAGLAFAAAVNVKIIPLVLVCPILAGTRSLREVRSFCLGASVGLIPFLVAWWGAGSAFVSNVFAYASNAEPWGVRILISQLSVLPGMSAQAYRDILIGYEGIGRWLLLGSILVLSGYGYARRLRVDWLMTYAFALFLVLAPGFGVQYVAYLAPLLFAVAPRWAFAYATVSGLFIGFVYAHFQIAGYPLESRHTGQIPVPTAFVGFAAWCLVVAFLGVTLNRGSAIDGIGPATGPDAQ